MNHHIFRLILTSMLCFSALVFCMENEHELFDEKEIYILQEPIAEAEEPTAPAEAIEGVMPEAPARAMPAASVAFYARFAQQEEEEEFAHTAIISLPQLPPQIIEVILANVPQKVDDIIKDFEKGVAGKCFLVFKGVPGTGKTSLAYALAGSIGASIIHIQASGLITPLQGSGESTLDHDFEQIFHEAARVRRLIVLIDEIDQVYGYHDEIKETAVMLHFKSLIGDKSPANIMYIGTTNKYESIDPSLQTHITHPIEIPYPSRDYYKAIIRVLLPEANDVNYQCEESLIGEAFLNRFADQLVGISIREVISIVTRSKGHALTRQHPQISLCERYRTLRAARAQGLPDPQLADRGQAVQLGEQDFTAVLEAYKAERDVQQGSRFNVCLTRGYEVATRLLPYARLAADSAKTCYDFNQQKKHFQERHKLAIESNAATCVQIVKSAAQFFTETTTTLKQTSKQFMQNETEFETQKKESEKEAAATIRMGACQATLKGAGIGITVGTSIGGPIGAVSGGVIGGVAAGGLSYGAAYAPKLWRWIVRTTKSIVKTCTFQ